MSPLNRVSYFHAPTDIFLADPDKDTTQLLLLTDVSYILEFLYCIRSLSSSGSLVSDYGLDDQVIGVQSQAGAKDFSSILYV
jgi:hypothetical protein